MVLPKPTASASSRRGRICCSAFSTAFTWNLSVTIEHLIAQLSPEAAKRIEVTNLHQLACTICLRSEWRGRIADNQELGEIWDAMLPPASEAVEFDRQFVKEEYESVVDAMGIDTEEEYLTVVRTGRPKLSRQQRRKLWPNFLDFNRRLQKKGLLTFEGTIHQARMIVENARGENSGLPKYRHVLVDELQDFGLEGLRLIAALSPRGETANNPLFMVGDGHQRINRRIPIPLSRAGINVVGRSRRLKINYRTSAQIRAWAQSLLAGMDIDDLDGGKADTTGDRSVFKGPEPSAGRATSIEQAASLIADWASELIEKEGLGSHEICVAPVRDAVKSALAAKGIGFLELKARRVDPGKAEPGVRLGSILFMRKKLELNTKSPLQGLEECSAEICSRYSQQSCSVPVGTANRGNFERDLVPNRHAAIHGLIVYNSFWHSLNTIFMTDFAFQVVTAIKQLGVPEE